MAESTAPELRAQSEGISPEDMDAINNALLEDIQDQPENVASTSASSENPTAAQAESDESCSSSQGESISKDDQNEPDLTPNLLFKLFSDPVVSGHLQDAQVSALFIDAMHNPQNIHMLNDNENVRALVRHVKTKMLFEPYFFSKLFKKFMVKKNEEIVKYLRENFEVEETEAGFEVDGSKLSEGHQIENDFLANLHQILTSLFAERSQHFISLLSDMTETGTTLFMLLCEFVYRIVYAQTLGGMPLEEASGSQGETTKQSNAKKHSEYIQQTDNKLNEPNANQLLSFSECCNRFHIRDQVLNKVARFDIDFEEFLDSGLDAFIALEQTKMKGNMKNNQPCMECQRSCTDKDACLETYLTSTITGSTYWKQNDETCGRPQNGIQIRLFNTIITSANMWQVMGQYISRWYPQFRAHTRPICIPQVYQCLDMTDPTSTRALGHKAEMMTVNSIKQILCTYPGRSLILQGMEITKRMRKYLCDIFATGNYQKAMENEEKMEGTFERVSSMHEFADIIVLHEKLGIWLVEDKATTPKSRSEIFKFYKAQQQLERGKRFFNQWLGINVPIKMIIALPHFPSSELVGRNIPQGKNCIYFCQDHHSEASAEHWLNTNQLLVDCGMTESDYTYLFLALTMTQIACFSKLPYSAENNPNLNAELQRKYDKVISKLGFMKKNKDTSKQQQMPRDKFYEITLLTPEQAEIFHCEAKLVLIEGPASSGKTVLIQLKALQQYRNDNNIIIVTPEYVWPIYKQFFTKNNIACPSESTPAIKLVNYDAFLNDSESMHNTCIFFDEDLDMVTIQFEKKLKKIIDDALQIWIAFDRLQINYGTRLSDDFKEEYGKLVREFELSTALRCTAEIYETWKDDYFGKENIQLGHNIIGPEPKCIQVEDSGSYLHTISQLILVAIQETRNQLKSLEPYRIGIVATMGEQNRDKFLKIFNIINNLVSDGPIKFVSAKDRFDEQTKMMKEDCVTVDIAANTKSHEFSAVIEIVDPGTSPTQNYITKSRAISQYISIKINRKLQLEKYFEYSGEELEQLQYDTLISKVDNGIKIWFGRSELLLKSMQQIMEISDPNSADFIATSIQLLNNLHPFISHHYATFHYHVLLVHYWLATHKQQQFNADWSHPCIVFRGYCHNLHLSFQDINKFVHWCVLQLYEGNTILPMYVCWNMYSALTQYNYFKQVCTIIGEKGVNEGTDYLLKMMIGEYTRDEGEQVNIWNAFATAYNKWSQKYK